MPHPHKNSEEISNINYSIVDLGNLEEEEPRQK
jgi:hypothetical protein